jgi:RNA polymerase sigma factor (sigma-70 family)
MPPDGCVAETIQEQLAEIAHDAVPRLLLLLIRKYRLDSNEAREAVQDAFLTVLRRGDQGVPVDREHLFRYLAATAMSRANDRFRSSARRTRSENVLWAAVTENTLNRLIEDEQRQRLREAIEALQPPYRDIFTLLVREELPLVEVAARLGTRPSSIYKQYARGVDELRKKLRY